MNLRAIGAAVLASAMSVGASADEVDFSLSNDTAKLDYSVPLSYSGYGRTDMGVGLLYTESNDLMGSLGILMMGEAGSGAPGLNFGVGIRMYAVSLDGGYNVGAVTLGAKARYAFPAMNRLALVAEANYAPDITTFGDADRFWAFQGRLEYEVLPEAAIYVGYRKIQSRVSASNRAFSQDLDAGWNAGLRMSF